MLDLTDFLTSGNAYPYTAELPLGGGNKLAVTYRASSAERAQAAILDATRDGLTALGFDPLTALKAAAGQMPKGAALTAFTAALEALDTAGEEAFAALMQQAEGASLADILGSLEAVLPTGAREAFEAEINAATCAALPGDVKRTILDLAAKAVLPADKLAFLGK